MADQQNRFFHRKKIMTIFFICALVLIGLFMRLLYLMVWRADYYEEAATRLHERERSIKAARGRILDRNGVVLADNKTVCTVSVIHNQITEPEKVIAMLVKELKPGALDGKKWFYYQSSAYDLDMEEAQRYDDSLEKMEKGFQPSQEEFYILSNA